MSFNIFSRVKEAWSYRQEPESMRALGIFYWRMLLLLALLVALFAFYTGWQELDAVLQSETAAAPSSSAKPLLDPSQLGSTLELYSARQTQYQSLSQSPAPAVPDPSQ